MKKFGSLGLPKYNRKNYWEIISVLSLSVLLVLTISKPLVVSSGFFDHDYVSLARQACYIILALATAFLSYKKGWRSTLLCFPLPIIVTLSWFCLTITWSASPQLSIQKLLLSAMVVFIVFSAVSRIRSHNVINTIRVILFCILTLNYLSLILYPGIAIHDYGSIWSLGQWRGIMAHKNFAGIVCAISVVFFTFGGGDKYRIIRYLLAALSAIFLYFTQSRTSQAGTVIAMIVGAVLLYVGSVPVSRVTPKHIRIAVSIGFGVFGLISIALLALTVNGDFLIGLTSDPKFWSGRNQIWQPMLVSYLERPFWGSGYGAYWMQPLPTSVVVAEPGNELAGVSQGHNGYLDLATQVGLPGLLLAIFSVAVWPVKIVTRLVARNPNLCALCGAIIVLTIASNMTESSLFDGDQLGQVFIMICLAMLMTANSRHRNHQQSDSVPLVRMRKTAK